MVLKKALFIGINYTGTPALLSGCARDAINMRSFLNTYFDTSQAQTVLLTDPHKNSRFLPTAANIRTRLKWLTTGLQTGDTIFLHYSGHGGYITDTQGEEKDRRDETIYPMDYQTVSHITDDELRRILVDKIPQDVTLLAVFDCCHSGTALDLKNSYRWRKRGSKLYFTRESNPNIPNVPGNVILISGCKDAQYSYEASIAGKVQGAMTYNFIRSYRVLHNYYKKKRSSLKKKMDYYHRIRGMYRRLRNRNRGTNATLYRKYRNLVGMTSRAHRHTYRAYQKQVVTYSGLMRYIVIYLKAGRFPQDPQISTDDTFALSSVIAV